MKRNVLKGFAAAVGLASAAILTAATVPVGFEVTLLTTGLQSPKGLDSAHHRAGAGSMGDYIYVAESGMNRIVQIDRYTGDMVPFADTDGFFPVGVSCFGGAFGQYMYVGNASGGGVTRIDQQGTAQPFALEDLEIAGLDFGKGKFGQYLYAGEWQQGRIWRIDRDGLAEEFATLPTCETRYLKFAPGGAFGHDLYFTDYLANDIYRVDRFGEISLFADLPGMMGLEGFAFGPGGAFGHDLYVGNLTTGEIYLVDPEGNWDVWSEAGEFAGVADIIFKPASRQGFTMYLVDGHSSLYEIARD